MAAVLDPVTRGYLALRPASAAQTLVRLDDQDLRSLLQAMPPQTVANLLEYLAPGSAAHCLMLLPNKSIGRIIALAPAQTALSALRLMHPRHINDILNHVPATQSANLRMRLHYVDTVIGAYIDSDVVTFNPEHRISDAIRLFRREGRRTGNSVHILDDNRRVVGSVMLNELLGTRDRTPVRSIMRSPAAVFQARAAIHTVREHPAWLDHDNLPVINRAGSFEGVLRRAKVKVIDQQVADDETDTLQSATTRNALAEIFWIAMGSLFAGGTAASTHRTDEHK
jgi:magnesium transporter